MSDNAYSACADNGPRHLHCERPDGHDGEHRALDGEVTWDADSIPDEQDSRGIKQCKKCGETDWEETEKFGGGMQCGGCGYRPRKERREEIKEVLK